MRYIKYFAFYVLIIAASIFQTACDGDFEDETKFADELQGTWLTNDYNNSKYYGSLEIGKDYIKITGYGENQTSFWEDDSQRPFKDNLKEVPLNGYSTEESKTSDHITGKIFIQDAGVFPEEGIPFEYWTTTNSSPDYPRIYFLRFTFGGRNETLVKKQNE
jgi:hypothetical protein